MSKATFTKFSVLRVFFGKKETREVNTEEFMYPASQVGKFSGNCHEKKMQRCWRNINRNVTKKVTTFCDECEGKLYLCLKNSIPTLLGIYNK